MYITYQYEIHQAETEINESLDQKYHRVFFAGTIKYGICLGNDFLLRYSDKNLPTYIIRTVISCCRNQTEFTFLISHCFHKRTLMNN